MSKQSHNISVTPTQKQKSEQKIDKTLCNFGPQIGAPSFLHWTFGISPSTYLIFIIQTTCCGQKYKYINSYLNPW